MFNFLKDKTHILFVVFFLASISPFIARLFYTEESIGSKNELFNKALIRLNSVQKVVEYTDSIFKQGNKETTDTSAYVLCLSHVIKERFYHSELDYGFSENWLAHFCGKLFWSHMSSMVIAEDIMKYSKGLCSQQTMVFMESLARKKINFRTVGLGFKEGPGHFVCEVQYNGLWHLYDVSMEPNWKSAASDHQSLDYYLENRNSFYTAYEHRLPKEIPVRLLERHFYGKTNEIPAKNMKLFHRLTYALTYILPVVFLLISVYYYRRKDVRIVKDEQFIENPDSEKVTVISS